MSLSAGIVGLPNVGKSTLFNALTKAGAESANYPFCTIDPNVGIVPVPDRRLQQINAVIGSEKIIPAIVEIVDIAGLVRGAAKGEGLGNKFLGNIREVSAILHVVRCFDDPNVIHVEGSVNPIRDVEIIDTELILADIATLTKRLERSVRAARGNDAEEKARVTLLEHMIARMNDGKTARSLALTEQERALIADSHLLTIKPVLYIANVSEDDLEGNHPHVEALRNFAATHSGAVIPVCCAIEAELADLEEADQLEMLEGLGIAEPALNVLIRATYKLLGLQSYFTAGPKEIRAWTIPIGALAPQAAAVIHSDFEKHFIRAEVYTVDDLVSFKGEAGIRSAGKLRVEGRDYVVQDGDVLHIRHSA
jgi:GTP-binding protein YchF